MARKRAVEPAERTDLGPRVGKRLYLASHADVDVIERKAVGRQAKRRYLHTRLYEDGEITEAEYEAAESWWQLHAIAAGADLSDREMATASIRGTVRYEPADRVIAARSLLRRYYSTVGLQVGSILRKSICDGRALRLIAKDTFGSEGGRACGQCKQIIVLALGKLAEIQ